mgnify:CR=1 FL=1
MNITKYRRYWFSFSAVILALSLVSVLHFGFNLGLDFTGGARWHVSFAQEAAPEVEAESWVLGESSDVSSANLSEFFAGLESLEKAPLIQASGAGEFLITLEDMPDSELQAIAEGLRSDVGDFEEVSYRKVDSSIGASFKRKAMYAILAALIGIIFFVAWAFRKVPSVINPWRFGGVAIAALFHDVLIILGVFVWMGALRDVELDLPFITALLATLGFSVNDTIVILDRVRENIRLQKAHETFEDTVENSVQQTLMRSINTSISTLLPLVALLIWGANSIFFFVLALTLGIVVGTYSSIFVAAPLLVSWKKWGERK